MPRPVAPDRVALARLRRPWGRRGELLIDVHTDWPRERFVPGRLVELAWDDGRRREQRIRLYRELTQGSLLAFEGVDDIGAARDLAGAWIVADPATLERVPGDELRHVDLVGLEIVSVDGGLLGWAAGVQEAPQGDLLRVRRPDGGEALAPLAPPICVAVDLPAGKIILDAPPGLLDPEKAESVEPRPARLQRGDKR